MIMSWWIWVLFGIGLLLLELITPGGFFVFFFGAGAILVGLLAFVGLSGPPWLEWLLFGVVSVGALAIFRKPLQKKLRTTPRHEVDSMVGETAVALEDIGIQGIGKAELRGSVWTVQNSGDSAIAAGQRCRVERVHGLTLYIRG